MSKPRASARGKRYLRVKIESTDFTGKAYVKNEIDLFFWSKRIIDKAMVELQVGDYLAARGYLNQRSLIDENKRWKVAVYLNCTMVEWSSLPEDFEMMTVLADIPMADDEDDTLLNDTEPY